MRLLKNINKFRIESGSTRYLHIYAHKNKVWYHILYINKQSLEYYTGPGWYLFENKAREEIVRELKMIIK